MSVWSRFSCECFSELALTLSNGEKDLALLMDCSKACTAAVVVVASKVSNDGKEVSSGFEGIVGIALGEEAVKVRRILLMDWEVLEAVSVGVGG